MPIITISRGTFSGGAKLAERLAQELGCSCLSREVISAAADRYGVPATAPIAALDHAPTLMDRLKRQGGRRGDQ